MKKTDRELLKDALFLIESGSRGGEAHDITEKIRARLAEPEDEQEDEPVCWFNEDDYSIEMAFEWDEDKDHTIPLYRHPPRKPVRLSDEEIREVMLAHGFVIKDGHSDLKPYVFQAVRAIEQAVLGKNQ